MWNSPQSGLGRGLASLLVAAGLLAAPTFLRAADEEGCLGCHGLEGFALQRGGQVRSLAVAPDRFAISAHGSLGCRDCHADIAAIPHPGTAEDVGCGQPCHALADRGGKEYSHEALYWEYAASVHGSQKSRRTSCLVCHPGPGAVVDTERRAKLREARQCAACHRDSAKVRAWFGDVHYQALLRGEVRAPSCPDCHSDHRVWPPAAKESSVNPRRLAETCAKGAIAGAPGRGCHPGLAEGAVRGAGMNVLQLGKTGQQVTAALVTILYGLLLLGLVVRAGLGYLRGR